MTKDIRIETERLHLRSWRDKDVAAYHRACNTPSVMRWLGGVQSAQELRNDVHYFMAEEARHGHTFWIVERKADKAFLGFCGFVRIPDLDSPSRGQLEIGWRIREDVWRNGYAFEAASAALRYAFTALNPKVLVSRAATGNSASVGLMRKLGLKYDPSLDYVPEGEIEALRTYTIIKPEWTSNELYRAG